MEGTVRKVLVVGAGSGIGAATAAWFIDNGDEVTGVDLRFGEQSRFRQISCDLRDPEQIDSVIAALTDDGTVWDAVAYVAGVPGTAAAVDVLGVNHFGVRRLVTGILPHMKQGGSVVVVASVAGVAWQMRAAELQGLLDAADMDEVAAWQAAQDPNYAVYSTSKEATILFVKRLASTAWTKYGVRVNTVSPGPVETPILADFKESMGDDAIEMVRSAAGRHGSVDDIAPIIGFLCSDAARWINAQDLNADAGVVAAMMAGPAITL